jgi:hypothetical protein
MGFISLSLQTRGVDDPSLKITFIKILGFMAAKKRQNEATNYR